MIIAITWKPALNNNDKDSQMSLLSFKFVVLDVNECKQGTHDCFSEHAQCVNNFGSFRCVCNHGYVGDGKKNCTEAEGKTQKFLLNFRIILQHRMNKQTR